MARDLGDCQNGRGAVEMVSKTDLNYCVPILYAQKILEAVDYEVSKFMANMPQLGSYAFSYVCVLGLRPDPE